MTVLKNALKQVYPFPFSFLESLFFNGEQGALYKPWELDTMFQDARGTIAVGIDDPVGLILDKSGNGNNASQSTDAARPMLRETAGGLRYLEFDGVDDFLKLSDDLLPLSQSANTLSSAAFTNSQTKRQRVLQWDSISVTKLALFYNDSSDDISYATGSFSNKLSSASVTRTNPVVISGFSDLTDMKLRTNGAVRKTGSASTGLSTDITMGANFNDGDPVNILDGGVYGVVIIDRALNTGELQNTESELAKHAGVTL